MKKSFIAITIAVGLGLTGMAHMLVSADTTKIEAELGGYNDVFKLSEIIIKQEKMNIYDLEKLDEKDIITKLEDVGLDVHRENGEHNIYTLYLDNEEIGDILINEYVTSLSLHSNIKILGGMEINSKECRKELEYILKYSKDNEESWIGTLNNDSATFDWNIDIGDEDEYSALGIIYNENKMQIDEYRIRYGFDVEGRIVNIQFNLFHKPGDGETI